jgi:hypothetical protein
MNLPDDQQRLRWLREDLASCLAQIGAIVRRGDDEPRPASRIAIEVSLAPGAPASSADESVDPPHPLHPPVSITWTGLDGNAVTYDWRAEAIRFERPSG